MPVQYLRGVGPNRAAWLEKLGVRTLSDLLLTLPTRYEDRSQFKPFSALRHGEAAAVRGEVISSGWHIPVKGKRSFEVVLRDGSAQMVLRWLHAGHLAGGFPPGRVLAAYGKVTKLRGLPVIYHPEFEPLEDEGGDDFLGVLPVYPLAEPLTQRWMRNFTGRALEAARGQVAETLPAELRERRRLCGAEEALALAHCPATPAEARRGRYRLVFEEFLLMQLALLGRKREVETLRKGHLCRAEGGLRRAFLEQQAFTLTGAQARCLGEILADMAAPTPMHRLLQGDVGSGKTVVACCAMLDTVESGAQAALMAPTEVLARQHFTHFSRYLARQGLPCALLTGDTPSNERRDALSGLRSGRIPVVVGTHALFHDPVAFRNLGLIVIDEQHKFGVEQRGKLYGKGRHPDVLVMSATPIPRTLAMTLYGDLDVSVIDELPANRREIQTRVIGSDKLPDAYGFIRAQVAKGRQAFLVYPLVETSELLELKAATAALEALSEGALQGLRLGLLTGPLPPAEKQAVMRRFREGEIDVLVSTTVVEVGVDVPNASVMLVENAEHFGLAQLHQLRGRIGRGAHKSFCILQGDPKSLDAWKRLKILEETRDGFRIAEEDLRLRGMGNLLGREQSGLPTLRVGDPVADAAILMDAREEALALLATDPRRERPDLLPLHARAADFLVRGGSLAQIG
jgi:ATP-dependent DNA helicase RecG